MACITITVTAPASNLVAGEFDVEPKTLVVGETFTVTQVVSNTGGSSGIATVDFRVGGINGTVVATKTKTIAAGTSSTLSTVLVADTAGQIGICATLR